MLISVKSIVALNFCHGNPLLNSLNFQKFQCLTLYTSNPSSNFHPIFRIWGWICDFPSHVVSLYGNLEYIYTSNNKIEQSHIVRIYSVLCLQSLSLLIKICLYVTSMHRNTRKIATV